ncbi:VWA domain-containing protein [Zavarzinella formosa]|uniref:VWA domain-containing protein n=1 Tax=Zavarzinella formosa TaxID=360055 RepID=UPI0003083BC7|nr:VWA domain-containing protein [Zavarzinella formosa]
MSDFHFLRPYWLLAVIPAVLLSWRLLMSDGTDRTWTKHIAPHLLSQLMTGRNERHWLRPATLLPVGWLIAVMALAGPAWQREPAPFAEDTAVLVIVVKVTPSMESADIQPSRLARAQQKIRDLLALRPGAKTALFAYAGSAHRVMPLTADADILQQFAGELSPSVMPVEGSMVGPALVAADETIKKSGQPGWILWIGDGASPAELADLAKYRQENRTPVSVLGIAADGPELDTLRTAAKQLDAPLIRVTADSADVESLGHQARFSIADEQDGGELWKDFGYWLVPLLGLVSLAWFRRGWMAAASAR